MLIDLQGCLDDIHGSYPDVFAHMLPSDATALVNEMTPETTPKHLQSYLVKRMEVEIRRTRESTADASTKARLRSASAPGAGLWLTVVPTCAAYTMPDILFCLALRFLLGEPVGDDLPFACCCRTCLDANDHFMHCNRATMAWMNRHHKLVYLLRTMFQAAGLPCRLEPLLRPGQSNMRADLLSALEDDHRSTAVDVAVIGVTAASHVAAAQEALGAAILKENEKVAKYATFVECKLRPFILEDYGALGPQAANLLSTLVGLTAQAFTPPVAASKRSSLAMQRALSYSWRASISVALQCGNAHVLLNGALNCKHMFTVGRIVVGSSLRSLGRALVAAPVF